MLHIAHFFGAKEKPTQRSIRCARQKKVRESVWTKYFSKHLHSEVKPIFENVRWQNRIIYGVNETYGLGWRHLQCVDFMCFSHQQLQPAPLPLSSLIWLCFNQVYAYYTAMSTTFIQNFLLQKHTDQIENGTIFQTNLHGGTVCALCLLSRSFVHSLYRLPFCLFNENLISYSQGVLAHAAMSGVSLSLSQSLSCC